MKSRILFFLYCGIILLAVGCGGKKTYVSKAPVNSGIPDFYSNPPKERGYLFGTGNASHTSMQVARDVSDLRAKKEVGRLLNDKVYGILNVFFKESAIEPASDVTDFMQRVNKSIGNLELATCTIDKRDYIRGTMFSLAKYPLDEEMRKTIINIITSELAFNQPLRDQFNAKSGFEKVTKELEQLQDQ